MELWRQEITAGAGDRALSVTVDAAGDVIAAGTLEKAGTGHDFAVVKFSGSSGAELWRQSIDGGAGNNEEASSVTVDGSGDVIAAGFLRSGPWKDFAVVKFSGSSGAELWRQEIDGAGTFQDEVHSVAVDASGDVIACGFVENIVSRVDFITVKFRGTDGLELWRKEIDGTAIGAIDFCNGVAVDL